MIMKRLNTKVPIDITFKKNTSGTNTIPTGSTNSWKLGNVSNAVRFIFLAFKPTAAPSFQINNALFTDHVGADRITSIRIQMNNNYYPIDRMEFDFANHNIVEPYNTRSVKKSCHQISLFNNHNRQETVNAQIAQNILQKHQHVFVISSATLYSRL